MNPSSLKWACLVLISFILIACAGPTLRIKSSVPSRIEAHGTTVCTATPCEISGSFYKTGLGACHSGADTPLEAFSISPNSGIKQSKVVRGNCGETIDVFFDMNSGGIVNTVQPTNVTTLAQQLEILNDLKNKNLITEVEYQQKREALLNKIK